MINTLRAIREYLPGDGVGESISGGVLIAIGLASAGVGTSWRVISAKG
jgi:hypothetical protein